MALIKSHYELRQISKKISDNTEDFWDKMNKELNRCKNKLSNLSYILIQSKDNMHNTSYKHTTQIQLSIRR